MRLSSFPAAIADGVTVLILGSMPGELSLRMGEYYAHPRNLFWRMMGDLTGVAPGLPYEDRIRRLNHIGIGLWDSLLHCERVGSLDSKILPLTEVPNDFAMLLMTYPTIRAICFNGKKSERVFRRRALPLLPDATIQELTFIGLPSTSPANAGRTYEQKLACWRIILEYLPTPRAM